MEHNRSEGKRYSVLRILEALSIALGIIIAVNWMVSDYSNLERLLPPLEFLVLLFAFFNSQGKE
jgi:membrane protein YdbS with pleckstrin-like domain